MNGIGTRPRDACAAPVAGIEPAAGPGCQVALAFRAGGSGVVPDEHSARSAALALYADRFWLLTVFAGVGGEVVRVEAPVARGALLRRHEVRVVTLALR